MLRLWPVLKLTNELFLTSLQGALMGHCKVDSPNVRSENTTDLSAHVGTRQFTDQVSRSCR